MNTLQIPRADNRPYSKYDAILERLIARDKQFIEVTERNASLIRSNKALALDVETLNDELDAKDATIAERDAEIADAKQQHREMGMQLEAKAFELEAALKQIAAMGKYNAIQKQVIAEYKAKEAAELLKRDEACPDDALDFGDSLEAGMPGH